MVAFENPTEAQQFIRDIVDVPVRERHERIGQDIQFHAHSQSIGNGRFTNIYDISYPERGAIAPLIHAHERLKSVYDFAQSNSHPVTAGGGFFYLADIASGQPRQLALNLVIADGQLRSLPVCDREAVLSDGHKYSAQVVQSLGSLSLNGHELSWSGSLSPHDTDVKVFGNGNVTITHEPHPGAGSMRVLDERSRLTPPITDDDIIDIGLVSCGDGTFAGGATSRTGGLDIFTHDVIIRCHERYLAENQVVIFHTIGGISLDGSLQGALTVGPMLTQQDFAAHPINRDRSLGSKPPFLERPLARTALYTTEDGVVHIRLFDGRPDSDVFPGVTPSEAVGMVTREEKVIQGCFLDPGQTAKLCTRIGTEVESLGNRHYLQWASQPGEKYLWNPNVGRPCASVIALQWVDELANHTRDRSAA